MNTVLLEKQQSLPYKMHQLPAALRPFIVLKLPLIVIMPVNLGSHRQTHQHSLIKGLQIFAT